MSKRARIAQLDVDTDLPTLTESTGKTVHGDAQGDDGRPTLDRGFGVDDLLDEQTHEGDRKSAGELDEARAIEIPFLITPPPVPSSERRKRARPATQDDLPKQSVWDAVEDRYKAEGHWSDLLEMYIQRVEGTQDLDVKESLFLRIGQVLRDELDDPQQALDAFVEALLLDPHSAEALKAVEGTARARGWWSELLGTTKRELANVDGGPRAVAICEHAMRWAETELKAPGLAEPFLDHVRKIDPGHPAIHRRLAAMYGEKAAWGSQRESLERALVRTTASEDRRAIHLLLGELNEQRFREYAEAARHYDAVLEIEPGSIAALQGHERICRLQERFGDLVGILEREIAAAEHDDARVEILVRLADLHERHFVKPLQAAVALEEAVRIDPRHPTALASLERCYQALRAWPELVRVLELRARMADSTTEQNAVLARIAELLELKLGDEDGATRTWRRIWDQDPSSERALSELARLAERALDWTAAAAYRAKLADLAPSSEACAKIHVAIAEMLSAPDRDPKLARVHYEKAASIHPNTTQAWEALEKEARRTGDTKRTALFLEKRAASTESSRPKAQLFVELAQLHAAQGDTAGAELAFERAVKADPRNPVAAEAMLAVHVRERRWAEAQPLCDVVVGATRETSPERAVALLQLATRISRELGQRDRAFAAALAAYRARPSVELAQDLVATCHDVRDNASSLTECAVEIDSIVATAMELTPPFVVKLARIREAQGAESDAMALFSKALIHDSEQRDALEGLADILVKREDWERACAFKQKLAHAVSDPEEQFRVLVDAGDLWAKRARNMPMAALAYEEALGLKPRDSGLLHTLLWLYGELACWEKLVETLRAVAELHEEPIAKAKSVYAMAMVVRDHLGDLRRAATLLEEVLDLDSKRLDAFERVVRVHTELRDWMELKHAYGRMLRRLKSANEDIELRHALFFQLGLIYRDRLGDAARALDAFRAAQRLKPDAQDVRKGIIELFVVTDQLDEGISMVRASLKKRPLDPDLYAELYELFLRKRLFDRAWCAVDALVALGAPLNDEKTRFYTDYPPPVLSRVPGTLVTSAWRSHILHADLDPALTAIFALVTPSVLRARVALVPFQQLRRSMGEPLRMNGAIAHEVLQAVSDACEILSFPVPSLHARKGQTVPLALAPAKNAMFVSIEACEAQPTDALAFVVGKRLAEMRPELTARAACPSVSELRGLLQVALQLGEPAPGTPNTGNPTFDRALGQSITREERQGLRAAISAAKAQGSELDVVRWSNLADISAARVGLLLSGRIDAARCGMTSDPQTAGDLAPRDKLSELLVFSVSDEYADLRQAIGMGVDANAAA